MAASVGEGDRVIPATLLGTSVAPLAASLDGSGLLSQPPHVGYVYDVSGTVASILWDNGEIAAVPCDDAAVVAILKLGVSAQAAALLGQVVRRTDHDASVEYTGVVLFVATIIASPLSPASAPVDFVVVQSTGPSQIYWTAPTSSIALAAGR